MGGAAISANRTDPSWRTVSVSLAMATPSELVGLGIPERVRQADPREDLPHLARVRPARLGAETVRIPGHGHLPELRQRRRGAPRVSGRRAPVAECLFRPEEEHEASSEHDVVPPLRGGNDAVE